ncbi:hypothetical protein RIF29_34463 [Crotalaria pallida]|uniref:Uncharacterized protein n=1 Tax=Crotalaria pallida TaxID=3830 RepID=A0AAN9EEQ5_CROPI
MSFGLIAGWLILRYAVDVVVGMRRCSIVSEIARTAGAFGLVLALQRFFGGFGGGVIWRFWGLRFGMLSNFASVSMLSSVSYRSGLLRWLCTSALKG